jgi:hypothetical protein
MYDFDGPNAHNGMARQSPGAGWVVTVIAAKEREKLLLGVDAELAEHHAEVVSHRVRAEVHLGCDRADPFTAREAHNDLPLTFR